MERSGSINTATIGDHWRDDGCVAFDHELEFGT